jgi:hypothetical protein
MARIGRSRQQLIARRALRRAIAAAYPAFARQHPSWVASFFDEHFLTVHAAPLLLATWESGRHLSPDRLADEWRGQFLPTNRIADQIGSGATQVAASFLAMLDAELDANPRFVASRRTAGGCSGR